MKRRYICYIRAIATAGSCVALLAFGWPLADEYLGHRQAATELDLLRNEHSQLDQQTNNLAKRHQLLSERLADFDSRSIQADSLFAFRDRIVAIVRGHGCRIRQVSVEEHTERPWHGKDDDPLVEKFDEGEAAGGQYNLVSSRLSLTITGQFGEIASLRDEIVREKFLAATEFISLQPIDATGQIIQMELRIKFFGIHQRGTEEFDELPEDLAIHSGQDRLLR